MRNILEDSLANSTSTEVIHLPLATEQRADQRVRYTLSDLHSKV